MIPTLFLASLVAFIIIQLPPGDFATTYASTLAATGDVVSQDALESLKRDYGLDQPVIIQYFKWMNGILTRGDFGISF
jgi:peptide/nickel transport system permease protein